MRRASMRWMCAMLAVGCGAASTPVAETVTVVAPEPVLLLGTALNGAEIQIAADGTIHYGSEAVGRLDADGTVHRADGSVCLRVAADGTIALALPLRFHDPEFAGIHIEGDRLILMAHGEQPMDIATVDEHGAGMADEHYPIEGLTPAHHRTVLAAYALMVVTMFETPMRMF